MALYLNFHVGMVTGHIVLKIIMSLWGQYISV